MSANAWHTDEIAADLKAGRKHTLRSEKCWCMPGQWYPEPGKEQIEFFTYAPPSREEADIEIIKTMGSLETPVAEGWVKCVKKARGDSPYLRPESTPSPRDKGQYSPEPEGVQPLMLTNHLVKFIEAQKKPNGVEWAHIKSLAGTVVSFWANGYANENARDYGKDLFLAKCVLTLRDSLPEGCFDPFIHLHEWKWNHLVNAVLMATFEPWQDQLR